MKKKSHEINKAAKKKIKLSQKAGIKLDSVIHNGEKYLADAAISLILYNAETVVSKEIKLVNECNEFIKQDGIIWINVVGILNTKLIESVGKQFKLHPLVLEVIAHTQQRPKFEEFDDYIFFTLKNLEYNKMTIINHLN